MIRAIKEEDNSFVNKLGKELKENFDISNRSINEKVLVYENDKEIIGFIDYIKLYEVVEILYICVKKEYRNKKIGSALLEKVFTSYNDLEKSILEVRSSNFKAIEFYKRKGYSVVRTIKNYYGTEDALSMVKEISMNKDVYILGIETSCDETSISIIKNGCEDIYTAIATQMDTHAMYGGVVPEIASRMHTEAITMVLDDVITNSNVTWDMIDAVAVTYAPGLMGCLLVGLEFAKTLAFIHKKPLIGVHHIAGHIYANNLVEPIEFPSLGLVVSGGHTELVLMKDDYDFEVLGSTLDDAIGECYDKIARIIGLKYPGGPNIEKFAKEGNPTYNLPVPMNDDSLNFSYSGLKSYIINLVHNETQRGNEINKYDLARSFQDVAVDELVRKTSLAIDRYNIKRMIVAGGVSANSYLRSELDNLCKAKNVHFSVPPFKYCTDNAAMIAAAAYPLYKRSIFADYNLNAKSFEYFFDKKD